MARQEIPSSGQWSAIAGLHNTNYTELYNAAARRDQVIRVTDTTQQTPGTGVHTVAFGSAAVNTSSDPISMAANNEFDVHQSGHYHFRFSPYFGRTASSGVAELYFRFVVDPTGVGDAYAQVGQSVEVKLDSANAALAYQAELVADLTLGWKFRVELQVAGQSDAGLLTNTAVPNGWNDVASADLIISRYLLVTPA